MQINPNAKKPVGGFTAFRVAKSPHKRSKHNHSIYSLVLFNPICSSFIATCANIWILSQFCIALHQFIMNYVIINQRHR